MFAGEVYVILLLACFGLLLGNSRGEDENGMCHKTYYKWPQCIDHPNGYGCECGPGFYWNTFMCVAQGVDSQFEFSSSEMVVQYALLLEKPFPELKDFSISFWVRPNASDTKRRTILSYSQGGTSDLLAITTGPTLHMHVHNEHIKTDIRFSNTAWTHIVWLWMYNRGQWQLYVNGLKSLEGRTKFPKEIPGGGELVLGQAARMEDESFDIDYAFIGGMSFVNIYKRVLEVPVIRKIFRDCTTMECGDAVEWGDFRTGTRGSLKVRWPSGILDPMLPCFTDVESYISCDRYCSLTIGAQCNAEIVENIAWQRTPADAISTMPCPRQHMEDGQNATEFAVRRCVRFGEYDGEWLDPDLEQCVSHREYAIKTDISLAVIEDPINETDILRLASMLDNQTADVSYDNPLDIATVIDSLELLVRGQNNSFHNIVSSRGPRTYGLNRERDKAKYPAWEDTQHFSKRVTRAMDQLLEERNMIGWNAQNPQGTEGEQFIKVSTQLMDMLAKSLKFHLARGDLLWTEAELVEATDKLAYIVKMYRTEKLTDLHFPYEAARRRLKLDRMDDYMVLPSRAVTNGTILPDLLLISTARYDAAHVLPHHDLKTKSKDNNVNSGIYAINFHMLDEEMQVKYLQNLSAPIRIKFHYLDNFNISNPECVSLRHATRKMHWNWTRDGCKLVKNSSWHAWCECTKPGVFAVITDMYDDNWVKPEDPLILMAVPSYIGCSASALMCMFSALMLIYLRTSSQVSHLHKHFALSIILSQCSFMFGIDRLENPVLCQVCAIAFHYFFLATFSWLMNEAFNLYIIITYAAHSHGEHTEGGSQWRFYILGWVLPGILVGAFVGAHTDDYYAPDMCWIDWQYVWLFLGPAVGMVSVTILVMIFTVKEHHESSYSKNEATNNQIVIYSKALWTQIILLTVCWSFAILTIRMRGVIIKWIYALFNTIQGAFFVVFYFLLNEEIRTVYKANAKKNSLAKQGYDYSPTGSIDEEEVMAMAAIHMGQYDHDDVPPEPGSSRGGLPRRTSHPIEPYKPSAAITLSPTTSGLGLDVVKKKKPPAPPPRSSKPPNQPAKPPPRPRRCGIETSDEEMEEEEAYCYEGDMDEREGGSAASLDVVSTDSTRGLRTTTV